MVRTAQGLGASPKAINRLKKAHTNGDGNSAATDGKKPKKGKMTVQDRINLLKLDVRYLELEIVGASPLIVNKFSEKAQSMILAKHEGLARQKTKKDSLQCYWDSLYLMSPDQERKTKPRCGFPVSAFKKVLISATRFTAKQFTTKFVAGAVHFDELAGCNGLAEIYYKHLRMRTDPVRLPTGVADIRHRGEFDGWSMKINCRYNGSVITAEEIINLLALGGFSVGLGEWRPEKGGNHGCFDVKPGRYVGSTDGLIRTARNGSAYRGRKALARS